MGSVRLPWKVMRHIGGKTILQHILQRYFKSGEVQYCSCYIKSNEDDVIADFANLNKSKLFRGDEKNVLSRYLLAAHENTFGHVIRLTADNILTDYVEMERLVSLHLNSSADYSTSLGPTSGLPIGVGTEFFYSNT